MDATALKTGHAMLLPRGICTCASLNVNITQCVNTVDDGDSSKFKIGHNCNRLLYTRAAVGLARLQNNTQQSQKQEKTIDNTYIINIRLTPQPDGVKTTENTGWRAAVA